MYACNNPNYYQGIVFRKDLGLYRVQSETDMISCTLSSKINKKLVFSADNPGARRRIVRDVKQLKMDDPVVVGDSVHFLDSGNGTGMITEILPRRNQLIRRDPAPGNHPFEQVIASNLDFMIPVFAVRYPEPKWGMLDRYLVAAESLDLHVLIVITKTDLQGEAGSEMSEMLNHSLDTYRRIGYPVVLTSSRTGEGIDELRRTIKNQVSVFVGKSGVGKTSLLNAFEPGLGLRVRQVSEGKIGKGRHTTSHVEMIPLGIGGGIVDTPGTREFGLRSMDDISLAFAFPEMRSYIGKCRFGISCAHDEEPGCLVRQAVMDGEIDPNRYHSYIQIRRNP